MDSVDLTLLYKIPTDFDEGMSCVPFSPHEGLLYLRYVSDSWMEDEPEHIFFDLKEAKPKPGTPEDLEANPLFFLFSRQVADKDKAYLIHDPTGDDSDDDS